MHVGSVVQSLCILVQCSVDLPSSATIHVSYQSAAKTTMLSKLHQKAAPCTTVIKLKPMQCMYAANVEELK